MITNIATGEGRVVLVVAAHADDPTLFCGGTIARFAAAGWRVVVCRVTDDRWDSVGVDEATTIARSLEEFTAAMDRLMVAATENWNWPTDAPLVTPAKLLFANKSSGPSALTGRTRSLPTTPTPVWGRTTRITGWSLRRWPRRCGVHSSTSTIPNTSPRGSPPTACLRSGTSVGHRRGSPTWSTCRSTLDVAVDAALCHDLPLRNLVHQLRLQARTGGWRILVLDEAQNGDLAPVVGHLLRSRAVESGEQYGLGAAEVFRVVRFGGMAPLLEVLGERITETDGG